MGIMLKSQQSLKNYTKAPHFEKLHQVKPLDKLPKYP